MMTRWRVQTAVVLMAGAIAAIASLDRARAEQSTISAYITDSDVLVAQNATNFRCKINPVQQGFGRGRESGRGSRAR